MINKIKIFLVILASFSLFAIPVAASATNIGSSLACGANLSSDTAGAGCATTGGTTTTGSISTIINDVITIFSWIVGSISVIMVIYGGFRYVTSGGNDQSVSGAKNTIVYALIGLVIVALAQVIVHFVLAKALTVGA